MIDAEVDGPEQRPMAWDLRQRDRNQQAVEIDPGEHPALAEHWHALAASLTLPLWISEQPALLLLLRPVGNVTHSHAHAGPVVTLLAEEPGYHGAPPLERRECHERDAIADQAGQALAVDVGRRLFVEPDCVKR